MASLLPRPNYPGRATPPRINTNPTVVDSGMQINLPSKRRKRIRGPRRDIKSVSERAATERHRASVQDYWEREGVTKAAYEEQLANEADQMMTRMNQRHQTNSSPTRNESPINPKAYANAQSTLPQRSMKTDAINSLRKAGQALAGLDEAVQSRMRMSPEHRKDSGIHGQMNWALTGGNPWSTDPDRYDNDLSGWAMTAGMRGAQAAGLTTAGAALVGTTQALHDLITDDPQYGSIPDYQEQGQLSLD